MAAYPSAMSHAQGKSFLLQGPSIPPQVLELSGIGQADILKQFEIPVVINLPGLGNNFQDHPYVGVVYYCKNHVISNVHR